MLRTKIQKEHDNAAYAGVKKEMAKPRMAGSVRIAELNLDIPCEFQNNQVPPCPEPSTDHSVPTSEPPGKGVTVTAKTSTAANNEVSQPLGVRE